MADPFISEIRVFSFNFAPRGWAVCDGSLYNISQNTALFSLLGTTYGGDGITTFGLPDLRSRCMIGFGQGPGLTPRILGEKGGSLQVALTAGQLPAHVHQLHVSNQLATTANPASRVPAASGGAPLGNCYGTTPDGVMLAGAVRNAGNGQVHENRMPQLVLLYCMAIQGTFPSRS